jgi:hypothetical protein
MIVSIGELQKNISLIKNTKEPIIVIDKRTKKKIAKIEPIKEENDLELFNKLLSFEKKVDKPYSKKDFEKIYTDHLKKKYDIS